MIARAIRGIQGNYMTLYRYKFDCFVKQGQSLHLVRLGSLARRQSHWFIHRNQQEEGRTHSALAPFYASIGFWEGVSRSIVWLVRLSAAIPNPSATFDRCGLLRFRGHQIKCTPFGTELGGCTRDVFEVKMVSVSSREGDSKRSKQIVVDYLPRYMDGFHWLPGFQVRTWHEKLPWTQGGAFLWPSQETDLKTIRWQRI